MGSNLTHEGLEEVLRTIKGHSVHEEVSVDEVNKDWRRLASFMAGRK